MASDAHFREQIDRGGLPAALVAALTGIDAEQLAAWRVSGVAPATADTGGDASAALYGWDDYTRVRSAAALLDRGLSSSEAAATLARLDDACLNWHELPHTARRDEPIGKHQRQRAAAALDAALPGPMTWDELRTALEREGALGKLCRFAEWIDMDPAVQDGLPTLRGRRLNTWVIADNRAAGVSDAEIARQYGITVEQVRRATAFERALSERPGSFPFRHTRACRGYLAVHSAACTGTP